MDEFRWRHFCVAALVGLLAAGFAVQTLLGAGFDRNPRIHAVRAKADAFVSSANRTKNFGRERNLLVDGTPTLRAYVRFDADLSSDEIQHVSLLLYSRNRSRIGYQVHLVDANWRERQINYANAPLVSPRFVASGPLRAKSWKAVEITNLVVGEQGRISLALTTASANGTDFASRETGLHGPRLVVEQQQNATTSTGTTSAGPPGAP